MSDVAFLMYLIRSLLLASTDIIIKNYPSSPNTSKVKIPLILLRLRYHLTLIMVQDRGMLVRIPYYSFISGDPVQKSLYQC